MEINQKKLFGLKSLQENHKYSTFYDFLKYKLNTNGAKNMKYISIELIPLLIVDAKKKRRNNRDQICQDFFHHYVPFEQKIDLLLLYFGNDFSID